MSHTEVYDPRATERALINEVNRAVRHCRIGHVKWNYRSPFAGLPVRVEGAYGVKMTEAMVEAFKGLSVRTRSAR